jgi:hypothetical protein
MDIFQTLVEDTSVNFTEVHFDMAISICEKAPRGRKMPKGSKGPQGAARHWAGVGFVEYIGM